jgi:hypothetical protein
MADDITRVASKVRAFRADYPPERAAIHTSFTEDEVGGVARVIGCCRVVLLETGALMAEAYGTRALRPPLPGKQGHLDTRDPERAMTQATGRAMGLLGYADGESLEGDTDEPDESGVTQAAQVTEGRRSKRGGATSNGADAAPSAPMPEDWESKEEMDTQHEELRTAINEAPSVAVVAGMRDFRKEQGYPWPMSKGQLTDMWSEFVRLTEGEAPKADPETGEVLDPGRPFTEDEPVQQELVP